MINDFDAVIFDLDGTLIDSMWVWSEIDRQYLAQFNLTPPKEFEKALEGMSFTETATYFKEYFKLEDSIEQIKDTWNQMAWVFYTEKITLKPGVMEFLSWLKEKNIKMGIATSNSKELVQAILKKHQLTTYFDSVRTSCEVEKGKPFPYIYLKVAEDLSVMPSRCLVFEDIPNGIIGAKRAGMKAWAIEDRQEQSLKETLYELSERYVGDYLEAMEYLKVAE